MTLLQHANQALREKRFPEPANLYLQALQIEPGLTRIIVQNLQTVSRRIKLSRSGCGSCWIVGTNFYRLSHGNQKTTGFLDLKVISSGTGI